jgi:hypothetical protein
VKSRDEHHGILSSTVTRFLAQRALLPQHQEHQTNSHPMQWSRG